MTKAARKVPVVNEDLWQWIPLMQRVALDNGIPGNELEDFIAQLFLEWIEGDYLNLFNPQIGQFTTYIWAFTKQRAMRNRDRGIRENKHRLNAQVVDDFQENETHFHVVLADAVDPIARWQEMDELKQIIAHIRATTPVIELVSHTFVLTNPDGSQFCRTYHVERSLATLAVFMLKGITQREIAAIYGRSVGTVASMVAELRQLPAILQYVLGLEPEFAA